MIIPKYDLFMNKNGKPELKEIDVFNVIEFEFLENLVDVVNDIFDLSNCYTERVILVGTDLCNNYLGIIELFKGSSTSCSIEYYEMVLSALLMGAKRVYVIHNHPSNTSEFSEDDIDMTIELKEKLELINITLSDHILITRDNFSSLKDCEGGIWN